MSTRSDSILDVLARAGLSDPEAFNLLHASGLIAWAEDCMRESRRAQTQPAPASGELRTLPLHRPL